MPHPKQSDEDIDLICQLVNQRRKSQLAIKKHELEIRKLQIEIMNLSNATIGAKFGVTASSVTHITRNLATD